MTAAVQLAGPGAESRKGRCAKGVALQLNRGAKSVRILGRLFLTGAASSWNRQVAAQTHAHLILGRLHHASGLLGLGRAPPKSNCSAGAGAAALIAVAAAAVAAVAAVAAAAAAGLRFVEAHSVGCEAFVDAVDAAVAAAPGLAAVDEAAA